MCGSSPGSTGSSTSTSVRASPGGKPGWPRRSWCPYWALLALLQVSPLAGNGRGGMLYIFPAVLMVWAALRPDAGGRPHYALWLDRARFLARRRSPMIDTPIAAVDPARPFIVSAEWVVLDPARTRRLRSAAAVNPVRCGVSGGLAGIVSRFRRVPDPLRPPTAFADGVSHGPDGTWAWVVLPARSTDEQNTATLVRMTADATSRPAAVDPAGGGVPLQDRSGAAGPAMTTWRRRPGRG